MKNPMTIGALALAAILALAGCSPIAASPADPEPVATAAEPAPEATVEPAPEPEPEPEPEVVEEGTRENPFAFGYKASIYETHEENVIWEITVNQPTVETDAIMAENPYNEAPEEGFEYRAVPVSLTWLKDQPVSPWIDFDYGITVAYVTTDGRTFEEEFLVQPWPSVTDIADLYQGGSADYVTVVSVPQGSEGTVRVTIGYDYHAFWG